MKTVSAILVGFVLLLGGCASHHPCSHEEQQAARTAGGTELSAAEACPVTEVATATPPARRFARGLIFDRRPGYYSASDFAYRSDWPSTDAYYRAPEIIFYREYFNDTQGPGFNNNDNTYRRFETYRYGAAVR